MWFFVFVLLMLLTPALVLLLVSGGRKLRQQAAKPLTEIKHWPKVGLIIPCAGKHPDMAAALTSLLKQSYPGEVVPVLVTATNEEAAARLVNSLQTCMPHVRHVVAGIATNCGQKNFNSLAGVAALGNSVDVYVFCDSTHFASPDFLMRLLEPIASGRADFSTGYHEVVPADNELVTLSYTMCVIFMRLMQSLAKFTEPWGGAMAIRRSLFVEKGIGDFWAKNVVDDCSLTTFLHKKKVSISLCAGALLRTSAKQHNFDVWSAWLERQILFLKFCVPLQWILLGLLAFCVCVTPVWAFLSILGVFCGIVGKGYVFFALVYFASVTLAVSPLRAMLPHHVPFMRWMRAFGFTCMMFFVSFIKTIPATGIFWHGIRYDVGLGGVVRKIKRPENN